MPSRKLHRIGVLTCHPTHHHMPNIYGPLIQCVPMEEDYTPTRMTGMELTHIWDHDPQRVESFCAKFGTVPVERYDDMVDKVDGIMLTNLCAGDYFHLLAAPYLQAGIPVFLQSLFYAAARQGPGDHRAFAEARHPHHRRFRLGVHGWGVRPPGSGQAVRLVRDSRL